MSGRYDASHSTEGQYQPGSDDRVLANKLGITDPSEMDEVELSLLQRLTLALLDEVSEDQGLTVTDLCEWHRRWLGNVYGWAGQYRSVNIGKEGFQFAAANRISVLMTQLDTDYLRVYTPCAGMIDDALIKALAVVHIEFVLVHPFREGNGRMARLISTIMALQAGKPLLDYTCLDNDKQQYFSAIRAGLNDDMPMQNLFRQVLQESDKDV